MESAALVNRLQTTDVAVINPIAKGMHPIQQWLTQNPGTGNYEIAKNIHGMSHCEVYNWLLKAVKDGEVEYALGKYYLAD